MAETTTEINLTFDISELGVHKSGTFAHIDIDVDIDHDGDVIDWTAQCAVDDNGRELKLDMVVKHLGSSLNTAVQDHDYDIEEIFEDQMDESDVESYYECRDAGDIEAAEYGGVE